MSKGAPASFQIPSTLLPLESAACQVIDLQGEHAWLSCYWREQKPDRGDHELIHLVVGRTGDFYDQPRTSQLVTLEREGWSFASWTRDDTIYLLATAAPMAKMTPFLSASQSGGSGTIPPETADIAAAARVLALIHAPASP